MSGDGGNNQHEKDDEPVERVADEFRVDDLHLGTRLRLDILLSKSENCERNQRHNDDGCPVRKVPRNDVVTCHCFSSPFRYT